MLKYPLFFYHCIFYCLIFKLSFSIHVFYLALFYITPTSGSFVLATEDGCCSFETCIVNLKSCASTSKLHYIILHYFARQLLLNYPIRRLSLYLKVILALQILWHKPSGKATVPGFQLSHFHLFPECYLILCAGFPGPLDFLPNDTEAIMLCRQS